MLIVSPFFCFANPAPFGLEVGKMTIKEFKDKCQFKSEGINKWTLGEMFSLSPMDINFKGLRSIDVVFDQNGVLVAVLTRLDKERFDSVLNMLQNKYRLIDKNTPFVGSRFATFFEDDVQIDLNAKHLSFEMAMDYTTKEFLESYKDQCAKDIEKIQQTELSNL
jgi:hypothetical protein